MGYQWFINPLLSWHSGAFEGQDWFTIHVMDYQIRSVPDFFFCSGYCISPTGKNVSPVLWRKVKKVLCPLPCQ